MKQGDSHLDPEVETAELRRLMQSTGVSDYLEEDLDDIELESADSLIARLKADEPTSILKKSSSRSGRPLARTLFVGTAAAVVATIVIVIQPWHTEVARAGTPPILDFEFAEAHRIADASGVDPGETLEKLARAADDSSKGPFEVGVQHVVFEGWTIDTDFDADPNSTITPRMSENWLYPDGRFRMRSYRGEPLKSDGRGIPLDGRVDRTTTLSGDETEAPGSRDAEFFTKMPPSIEGVRDAFLDRIKCLERQRGQERTLCLFTQVRDLSKMYVIPPSVMARIWRVLAEEEGIRSLGTVKDRTGRDCFALSFIWAGATQDRHVLLADADTGQIVGSETILIKPTTVVPVSPPAILDFATIVKSESQ